MSDRLDSGDRLARIALLVLACIWGADYLMAQPRGSLDELEHVIPLTLCGVLFLFFGVLGIIGELWMEIGRTKRSVRSYWWPSFTAFFCLFIMYSALGVGYLMEMIVGGHVWGMRAPAVMFIFAAAYWGFATRRRRNVTS